MKKILYCVFFLGLWFQASSQVSVGGSPLSISKDFPLGYWSIPEYVSPALDMDFVREDDTKREAAGWAPHFGKHQRANLTLDNSGVWNELPDGGRVWLLRIKAEQALGTVLYYDNFHLAEGAKFFVYSSDKAEVLGAFTSNNNHESGYFSTFLTLSDETVLELYEPASARGQSTLRVEKICHAYRFIEDSRSKSADFLGGGSGVCNVDIMCTPEGTNWQDQKRSVVRLLSPGATGASFCTGSLVNNVRQDCTPYILTANHCSDSDAAADYTQLAVQFNYFRPNCGNGTPITTNTVVGATFKARAGGTGVSISDFCLFQMNSAIPQAYNPFYAGWNASTTPSPSGVSVHHPSGDVMKISHYTTPTSLVLYSGAAGTTHWRADWVATTNGHGITEPGSSGSPLFNAAGQIIGDLSGGPSSCTATNKWDYYGAVSYSWLNNGATANNRMLKPWLDPDNTGTMNIMGTNSPCSGFRVQLASANLSGCAGNALSTTTSVTFSNFTGTVNLTAAGLPSGATYTFTPASFTATGTSNFNINLGAGTAAGTYTITVTGTSGAMTSVANLTIVVSAGTPSSPVLTVPADAATSVGTNPAYSWTGGTGGTYTLEVSTSNTFGTLVYSQTGITATNFTPTVTLSNTTTYYWRVSSGNACGTSANSSIFSFTTGTNSCVTVTASTGLPMAITDLSTINATLNFPGAGSITDINVSNLVGTHSYINDLIVTLISPSGTQVTLFNQVCGSQNNFNVRFDDAAASATLPCPPIGGGTFRPASPLSLLNGEDPLGTWTLRIQDSGQGDSGSLTAWSLDICYVSSPNACLTLITNPTNPTCNGGSNGAATTTVTGGTAPISYLWSNNATTSSISGLMSGTYSVTVTDNANCSATNTVTITQPLAMTSTIAVTATSGTGCTGRATATGTGGTTPYRYIWSNGATTRTTTGLCGGVYSVTVLDANNCSATASGNVTVTATPMGATLNSTNATCNNVCNGTATLQVTGGVTPYTYAWSNASTTGNLTGLCPGTYSVTISSANGSSITRSTTVTASSPLAITTNSQPNYDATNCNGSASAASTGGGTGATYTYSWSNAMTGASVSGVCHGNYTVTVTSSAGCTATGSVVVSNFVSVDVPGAITFSLSPNPHQDAFVVSLELESAQKVEMALFAADGKQVYQRLVVGQQIQETIQTGHLPAGVYFLRLINEGHVSTHKVLKK